MQITPNIESGWKEILSAEFKKTYFTKIKENLLKEYKNKQKVYPPAKLMFNAFNLSPFEDTKVIILGQDPYHGKNQAHGLSFSVPIGIKPPPSLKNIFKELKNDLGIEDYNHGNLESWASQGVLLLNSALSVRAQMAGSHQHFGWHHFTDAVIQSLSKNKEKLVFMLWGRFAQSKLEYINYNKHLVLTASHPSPFSAYNGFFGCRHFSKTNKYLISQGFKPINWQLPKINSELSF